LRFNLNMILDKIRRIVNDSGATAEDGEDVAYTFRVLFVCMGNICRSPTAEGAFKHLLAEQMPGVAVLTDSAGTHAYHVDEPPDYRAQRAAKKRDIDLSKLKARRVSVGDFEAFDLILAMDERNVESLRELGPPEYHDRIQLFLDYAPELDQTEVPDPYYGGANGFELVLDLVETASIGLIESLRQRGLERPPGSDATEQL
jgi:protein-tyrosine phosphatase